ncbi:MAG: hypothetical protein R2939_22680 [Kofleriaceae bacterium]
MALEHVAQGQTRLQTPGLAPDARGIALGRYALMVFPTLEGVVSWLRLYSAEAALDELLAGLEIVRLRSPLQSREMGVRIPAVSSYACDRAARLTRLLGGATYTGSARHFVKYRDERSPYGYDTADAGPVPAGADLVVFGDDFVQSYVREGELPLARLLLRLSLRRVPGDEHRDELRRELRVAVPAGLGDGVIRYLWRSRVSGEATLVTPARASAFADERGRSYLLLRLRDVPARIVELLRGVPGIEVFRAVGPGVAVALGWAHPIDLTSCQSVFPVDQVHVFWPGDRIDVLPGPLEFSDLAHLTRVDVGAELAHGDGTAAVGEPTHAQASPSAIAVALRLAPAAGQPRRVVATLIPNEHAERLRRLVLVLPPTSLRAYRVAMTTRGILVVGQGELDLVPLGELLTELAPGILVPLGLELVPRVAPDVLARALGHDAGEWTVFSADGAPFQLGDAELVSLERRALLPTALESAELVRAPEGELGAPTVVNDEVGRFALWGLPDPDRDGNKLLPP